MAGMAGMAATADMVEASPGDKTMKEPGISTERPK